MPNRSSRRALGEIIRQQRELAELSMRQFADLAGISNPYLSQIERGLRAPSEQVLDAIAKTLKVSADALYEQAGVPPPGPRRLERRARRDRRRPAADRSAAHGAEGGLRGVRRRFPARAFYPPRLAEPLRLETRLVAFGVPQHPGQQFWPMLA